MKQVSSKIIVLLCLISFGLGQNYNSALGIRGGLAYGLTYKHFTSSSNAYELLFDSRWSGFSITGMLQSQHNLETARLSWYWGYGAHVGFYDGSNSSWGDVGKKYTIVGIDGIIGLDYKFSGPFNISLDYKPALNLIGYSGFWGDSGALSIRYTF